ncbi:SH2 domain-containing protein [Fimicolochytrium jonesii]|uniref:SH2 domain-containing protein n=1 Tax=Fimicolochytrium jonesii TaxID=1396493 RepID=UPI0022FF0025|nr:SH2 domain-containing protein [Fimicolochytrium jonesii]KAI8824048.1 SH2 domain-containing protein [Fimicolochytrium jonesii]
MDDQEERQMQVDEPRNGDEREPPSSEADHEGEGSGDDTARPSAGRVGMYSDDDESEETEDDEMTEADKQFIVSDADEEEGGAEVSDDAEGNSSSQKRRKKRKRRKRAPSDSESDLDEDDLDLVNENSGGGGRQFKRLRRKGDDDELAKIFEDEEEAPVRAVDYDDDDGMEDFIIDDEEGEVPEVDRAEKLAQRKKERQILGHNLGRGLGISDDMWSEVQLLFDYEVDYGWALHGKPDLMDVDEVDDEGVVQKDKTLKLTDIYEPAEIAEKHLTDADELIRVNDVPERYQSRGDLPIPEAGELEREALYIGQQIFTEKHIEDEVTLTHPVVESIHKVLEFVRGENDRQERPHYEVPFIMTHRKDYVAGRLDRNDMWRVVDLDQQFIALEQKKRNLSALFKDIVSLSPEAVNDTYVEQCLSKATTVEAVADVSQYIQLRYSNEMAQAEQSRRNTFKKARRKTAYEIGKEAGLSKLVEMFNCDGRQIPNNITGGATKTDVPAETPFQVAARLTGALFATPEKVLDAARSMVAAEVAADPAFRSFVRKIYLSDATLTVTPTRKGKSEIDYNHPFYFFKYVTNKFLWDFHDGVFLQVMSAEDQKLIETDIRISAEEEFLNDIIRRVSFASETPVAQAWNDEIRKAMLHACRDIVFPQLVKWQKEKWAMQSADFVALEFQKALEARIEMAPYTRDPDTVEEWDPRVLAISWGDGEPNAPTWAVVLKETGELLSTTKLERLRGPQEQRQPDIDTIYDLIARHQPEVIVLGGFTPNTKTLLHRTLEDALIAGRLKDEIKIIFTEDEAARIFMNSERGLREFPEGAYPPLVRYLVSLGRKVQDPTTEYAGLMMAHDFRDVLALQLHPLQRFVPDVKLKWAAQKAFVNVVNSCGVDINLAAQHAHRATTLQFVAGLGPRKAQSFLSKISRLGGRLETRAQLIRKSLCGKRVFMNCASFIRIRARNFARYEANLDVLDDTRIHPEDYDLARKMAADALDYEDAAVEDEENPSVHVAELMESDADLVKLAHLALDEFALELERRMKEKKKMALEDIMKEIMRPFGERRKPFTPASLDEIFTMLTHETNETLREGSVVSAQITRVVERLLKLRLVSGLDGLIHIRQIPFDRHTNPPTSLVGLFREDTLLQARVVRVDKERMVVEMSLINVDPDASRARVPVDVKFDKLREEDEERAQKNIDTRRSKRTVRTIKHPYFKQMDYKRATQYLADKPVGAVVIRPSLKGNDHFSITWKVDEDVFQHVDVLEEKKSSEMDLGRVLKVEGEEYAEIDQIIAEHIEATSRKVQSLLAHAKFHKKTMPEMIKEIEHQTLTTSRSAYGLLAHPDQPCHFLLVYKHPHTRRPPAKDEVVVRPKGYMFRKRMFSSVDELLRYFKEDEGRRGAAHHHQQQQQGGHHHARAPQGMGMHLGIGVQPPIPGHYVRR